MVASINVLQWKAVMKIFFVMLKDKVKVFILN